MTVRSLTPTAKLLRQLVQIPSVNPDGNPGIAHPGELACAQFIATFLRRAGARVQLQPVQKNRPNVIGIFKPKKPVKRRLLLAPHTDTVTVNGMSIDPFAAAIKGGKLYGRGATDTKGPMAAMLQAVKEFTATAAFRQGSLEITFAGLMSEESGNYGALAWAKKCPRYDLAIIGEPTDLRIVHAHKGCAWLSFITHGKAAHASIPAQGTSAITAMLPVIVYLDSILTDKIAAFRHPQLGAPSIAVTTIQGGNKTNIIPAQCEIQADLRLTPKLSVKQVLAIVRQDFKKANLKATVKVNAEHPALHTAADHPLVEKILPYTKGLSTAPWFSDAAIFGLKAIPAIVLGPGSIRQAHTADEYISLAALEQGKAAYRNILQALL